MPAAMPPELQRLVPVCDAVASLLAPFAEVVLHDLESGTIAHIANAFSRRRVGDDSLIGEEPVIGAEDVVGPYAKTNWNGRRLKSMTAVIRGEGVRTIGLVCINHDIEAFLDLGLRIERLIAIPEGEARPAFLFDGDWREGVNQTVGRFLSERRTSLAGLTTADTEALIAALDAAGVFEIRNAVPHVTQLLGCSRATIYKRLATVRARQQGPATVGPARGRRRVRHTGSEEAA